MGDNDGTVQVENPVELAELRTDRETLVDDDQGETPQVTAEDMVPYEPFQKATDFILDQLFDSVDAKPLGDREKEAFAKTSHAVAIKHIPASKASEETALVVVCIPLGIKMVLAIFEKWKNGKQAPVDTGSVGERKVIHDETGDSE